MSPLEPPLRLWLRKLELHAHLSPEDRAAVLALPCRMRSIEAGSYLTREGDEPATCAVLVSGLAYRQKITGDGHRQIVAIHIPGEALDLQHLFLDVADHNVQMLTHGEVAVVSRHHVHELVRARPAVANAVVTSILVEASIFREWVLNIGRRDARTRLAHLLCEFAVRMRAQRLADGAGYELQITQEQLADAVGLTPVHVNRTLKALQAEGLISRNKRTISFPSWERMREVADFNQRYLHLEPQQAADV
jgi:CRP-like cAMP-binding protein